MDIAPDHPDSPCLPGPVTATLTTKAPAVLSRHDQLPACPSPRVSSTPPAVSGPTESPRADLRRRSIAWALLGGAIACLVAGLLALGAASLQGGLATAGSLPWPLLLQTGLRAGGCGFFYGLLAFHLTRVDPEDSHLQAGLVGAVCGIHSLGLPLDLSVAASPTALVVLVTSVLPQLAVELLQAWLPVVAAALLLLWLPRQHPGLRP